MELTQKQKRRLASLAAEIVERHRAEFKPKNPAIKDVTGGQTVAMDWCGSEGDVTMCAITVKWWYSGTGKINYLTTMVHVQQQVYRDKAGRLRVRLVEYHIPTWMYFPWVGPRPENPFCEQCGPSFNEYQEIMIDTTSS